MKSVQLHLQAGRASRERMIDGMKLALTGGLGTLGLLALIVLLLLTELRTFLPQPVGRRTRTGVNVTMTVLSLMLVAQIVVRLAR